MVTPVFKKLALSAAVCLIAGEAVGQVEGIEYGTLTDTRDGKTYRTVVIGEQTWMAENLNYDTLDGTSSWCYKDSTKYCDIYGRLYSWTGAMNISPSYNSTRWSVDVTNHQGICPDGWRIPNDTDWDELITVTGGKSTAGMKLKAKSGWHDGGNGTDDYGFSALPGGGNLDGIFSSVGQMVCWWSTTEYNRPFSPTYNAYLSGISYSSDNINQSAGGKSFGFSVRCIEGGTSSIVPSNNRAAHINASLASVTVRNRTLTVKPSALSSSVTQIRLIDMRGKSVSSFTARGGSTASFSLAKIPAGMYFVEVRDGVRRDRVSVVVGVR